jgi:small-conductance mechanosensitive channel
VGFIFNCTGNFILSKIVILAALDAFFLIIMLYFVIIGIGDYIFILGDYLYRSSKSFKPDLYSFYLGLKPYLIFFAFIYWIASLLINIELFDPFVSIVGDFLQKPRYASNFIFTFSNVAGFILYIGGSFLISNLLKPLFTTNNQQASQEHSNWANYIFLIRFVIISTGFLLALSSAGIPLSTITVVLGAVGVGLGFGLQNIFNNLFSGLLIAFERPFKVGDVLSIPEGLGKVKEIGLRSSIIFTNNGSEIVVPNGDLISNSFTNWTLSNSNTKLTIQVPVSRDTEIGAMKNILHESINGIEAVMLDIKPEINITSITANSLIFELECWISDILLLEETKAAIYENLVQLMLKNNIKSPTKISTDSLRDS